MAKRNRTLNQAKIENRIKEGRGQGHGKEYIPWLTIRDVASKGLSYRVLGKITGRVHHLLSSLEYICFLVFDNSIKVVDIREQYPLPLEETLKICERLGIKHPLAPGTNEPVPLTTDFILDIEQDGRVVSFARTMKYSDSEDLEKPRTFEKFEIERTYWIEMGLDWKVITEFDIPQNYIENIKWLKYSMDLSDFPSLNPPLLDEINHLYFQEYSQLKEPFGRVCSQMDDVLNLNPGTILTASRYLIATQLWEVNKEELIDTGKQLKILKTNVNQNTLEEVM